MNNRIFVLASAIGITLLGSTASSQAQFIQPTTPTSWTRPTTTAQATATSTTYQEWDGFTSGAGPNAATTIINPNGVSNAYDATSATDGVFNAGTDLYSFSASLNPVITVPGYGLTNDVMSVLLQAQSYGSDINTADVLVTYTDKTGTHTVQASTLPNYSYTQLYTASSNVGFGEADQTDHAWTFSVPDSSTLSISLGWDAVSSALQDLSVDTKSTASVPEPVSLAALLVGGSLLLGRKRRTLETRDTHAAA